MQKIILLNPFYISGFSEPRAYGAGLSLHRAYRGAGLQKLVFF
jgi:hypothetical protein